MSLATGDRFGHYEIRSALGAGGMGEVYRARDPRLKRDVAVKVVSRAFSKDPERLARFEREAELLASLNHPNIAAVYGFENADGVTGIILELVEGATLEERIAEGPIPIDDAIGIARQIADALEAAHDQGIVHRDLKPANIKLRPDGTVKVLDFGLAKALDAAAHTAESPQSPQSPTLTSPALMTQAGVIMGTAAYMSPEQAKGRSADKRSDVWAFGCVVYEMVTGIRAFDGGDVVETLAKVLRDEPKWDALPKSAASMSPLLQRCLEKDPKRRLRDIGDAKFFIDDTGRVESVSSASASRTVAWIAAGAVAGLIAGSGATAMYLSRRPPDATARLERFEIASTLAEPLSTDAAGTNVAISPDGSRIVYTAGRSPVSTLLARHVEDLEAKPVAELRATDPFFSPDGRQIGFATLNELKRAPAAGGPSVKICGVSGVMFRGASWGRDDSIVFAQAGGLGLFRVPASGGQPELLAAPDAAAGEQNYYRPTILPDGQSILYTVMLRGGQTRIAARKLPNGVATTVLEGGFGAQYLPSGHLVYGQNDLLMAVPFDLSTLRVTGLAIQVEADVATKVPNAVANAAVAGDGTMVYVPGRNVTGPRHVVWIDQHGNKTRAIDQPLLYPRYPRLSPDGRRLALTTGPSVEGNVWVYDLTGASQPVRLTVQEHNLFPIWSPSGKHIAFLTRAVANHLSVVSADGSSVEPEVLTTSVEPQIPDAWSSDGSSILFDQNNSQTRVDLSVMQVKDRTTRSWLATRFDETEGRLSPNEEWMAYTSDQTGRPEVWIRRFRTADAPLRVSSDGGRDPVWARDGKDLFFRNGFQILAARIAAHAPEMRFDKPRLLFEGGFEPGTRRAFDVGVDGRLLMIERADTNAPGWIAVVKNLGDRLKSQPRTR